MSTVNKRRQSAEVDSSYSVFFLIATIGICLVLTNSNLVEQSTPTLIGSIGYALVIYLVWDLIKQLYSPGQSLLLHTLTFLLLPYIIALSFHDGSFIFVVGWLTYILATFLAGILEMIYEFVLKSRMPHAVMKRLFMTDNALDKSLLSFNDRYLSFFSLSGIIVYLIIVATYYAALSLLFSYM